MYLDKYWEETAIASLRDPRSDEYDKVLIDELDSYNRRFGATTDFRDLRLFLFKALLLTESGGPSNYEWKFRPMQIGNPGDPGYEVLRRHAENSAMIMSERLQHDIATQSIDEPVLNIRAAIALILTMAGRFRRRSELERDDGRVHIHVVREGESLVDISLDNKTTVEEIKALNPGLGPTLHDGQQLKFRHAHWVTEIVGWRDVDVAFLASRYNGDGDPDYAGKISYLLERLA
jgi:hypothetical protein